MSTVRVPRPLTRLARGHGFTRSPLRRSTDRVEAVVTAVAAALALLAVLLATIIVLGSYQRAQGEAATNAAQRTPVTAVLLTDVVPEHGMAGEPTALARWQLPNGQQRNAPLWVSADRHVGDRISIWTDQQGNRVDPPETPALMLANAVVNGVAVLAGGWVLLGSLRWTACRVLDRINTAWWELEWAHIEPGWSRRTWQ